MTEEACEEARDVVAEAEEETDGSSGRLGYNRLMSLRVLLLCQETAMYRLMIWL